MNKIAGLALLAVGVVLLALGINASDSLGSEISEFFTGEPTQRSIWLILGGVLGISLGGGALFFGSRPRD